MKRKKYKGYYFLKFVIVATIVSMIHFLLIHFKVFNEDLKNLIKIDFLLFLIFSMGSTLVTFGIKKSPKNIVPYFLTVTTFQLLSAASIFLLIIYNKTHYGESIVLHGVAFFFVLLTIQSYYLILSLKETP